MEVFQGVCQLLGWQITDQVMEHSQAAHPVHGPGWRFQSHRSWWRLRVADGPPEFALMFHPVTVLIRVGNTLGTSSVCL